MFKRIALLAFVALCLIGAVASADWGGWQGPVNPSGGPISADMIVRQEGTMTVVWSESAGKDVYSSTAATAAIQYALSNLTAGRTWQEKVVINGNYTELDSLVVPSCTVVEIIGSLLVKDSIMSYVLGTDSATAPHDIEIFGGTIDANATQVPSPAPTYGSCGLYIWGAANVNIHDMQIYGGDVSASYKDGQGIYIGRSSDVRISNCRIDSARYNGILADSSTMVLITNCRIESVFPGGGQCQAPVQFASTSHSTLTGCVLRGDYIGGFRLAHPLADNNVITGNLIQGDSTATAGCQLSQGADANLITGNLFVSHREGVLIRSSAACVRNYFANNEFRNVQQGVKFESVAAGDSNLFLNNFFAKRVTSTNGFFDIGSGNTWNRFVNNFVDFAAPVPYAWDQGTATVFAGYTQTSKLDTDTVSLGASFCSDVYTSRGEPTTNYEGVDLWLRHRDYTNAWKFGFHRYDLSSLGVVSILSALDSMYVNTVNDSISYLTAWKDTTLWVAARATWNCADTLAGVCSPTWGDTVGAALDTEILGSNYEHPAGWYKLEIKNAWNAARRTINIRMKLVKPSAANAEPLPFCYIDHAGDAVTANRPRLYVIYTCYK